MPSEPDGGGVQAKLKSACFDYYNVQQLLARAEDEHLQLQSIATQLEDRVSAKRDEARQLKEAAGAVDDDRQKESELPPGVPLAAFDAFVQEEEGLLQRAQQAQEESLQFSKESAALEASLIQEGNSASVLEDAVHAQVQFGKVLLSTRRKGMSRISQERDRQSASSTRAAALAKDVAALEKKHAALSSLARSAAYQRSRAQTMLQERDADVLRLRRDAAFARRLYLGELEHAREQEAELERLISENRRLRSMVGQRREGRPVGVSSDPLLNATADAAAAGPAAPPRAEALLPGHAAPVPVHVDSNDVLEEYAAEHATTGKGSSKEGDALRRYRRHNLVLLQQVVSTMQALNGEMQKPPE